MNHRQCISKNQTPCATFHHWQYASSISESGAVGSESWHMVQNKWPN